MKALGQFILSVVSIALYIFVLSTLYGWFAIPAGAPNIGTANIYGLAMILSYVLLKNRDLREASSKDRSRDTEITVIRIVFSLVTLIVGWVVTLFM